MRLVYLKGSYDLIRRRMATRHEHFMPVALLDSQFATLQEPTPDEHPIIVDVGSRPAEIAVELVHQLEERHGTDSGIEFIATGGGRGNLYRRVTMTLRVKEILSWYGADSPGTPTNLARLSNHGRLAGTGSWSSCRSIRASNMGRRVRFAPIRRLTIRSYHFELPIEAGCNVRRPRWVSWKLSSAISPEIFRSSSRPTTMMYCGRRKIRTRH